jgi:hypothetical protein
LVLVVVAIGGTATSATAVDEPDSSHIELVVFQDGEWYTVSVSMLLESAASESDVAESRAALLARFPGAIVREDSDVTAQFTLTGPTWQGATTSWSYNSAGKPEALETDLDALTAAATTWDAGGSPFHFTGGTTTAAGTDGCGLNRDGANVVGWSPQAGATLGVTCLWSKTSGGKVYFVEFDMEFDPNWKWTTSTDGVKTDFQSVALHEFGHALGVSHAQRQKCPGPTMCASYGNGTLVRSLHADDHDALITMYGESEPAPTAISTPTATATAPPTATPVATPSPGASRGQYRMVVPGTTRQ